MRICSLIPSGTEILFALGLEDQLVGVTDLCTYPPEAKRKRVVCRSRVNPARLTSAEVEEQMQDLLSKGESPFVLDLDWLRAEPPDLILSQDQCYVCSPDAGEVIELGCLLQPPPDVLVLSPKKLRDIFENIVRVGEAAGARHRAENLVKTLQDRVEAVRSKAAVAGYRPRVFSLEGVNPLAVGGHWLPELKRLAGGRDELFQPGCPAQRIEWKTVRDYAPQVLVIDLCSSDLARGLRESAWLTKQEGWQELPAVQNKEVYILDHGYYSTPGPRIIQGLEILAQILHPECFAGMIPANTVAQLGINFQGEVTCAVW